MNSVKRVLTTISHKEPDRVPIGEWGIDHDHVSKIIGRHTYWRNRKDTTIALWENRRDEVVESLKSDYADLIEKLDYDVVVVELVPPKGVICNDPPKKIEDGVWEDSKGNIYKYAASNDSIMCVTNPPAKEDIADEEIDKMVANIPDFENGEFELVDYICQRYGKNKAIVFRGIYSDEFALRLLGGDQTHQLMMPMLNPDAVKRAMRYEFEYYKKIIDKCLKRKDITIIMHGRDYGDSKGCIESPKVIRDIYLPVQRKLVQHIQNNNRIPFLHCCGNVWEIMNDLVDTGYKGYQSIQGSAGMDIAKVKEKYGDKLTLWAGIQCETLVEGTKQQVEDEVRRSLKAAMPGGGFIFGSTNSVQYGANTDNYLYALDLVRKLGVYN